MFLVVSAALCPVRTRKAQVPKLDYDTQLSSVRLSNHMKSEAMHNVSAHQQQWYNETQWLFNTVWNALVMWYTCRKLVHTKTLQNFWLTPSIIPSIFLRWNSVHHYISVYN